MHKYTYISRSHFYYTPYSSISEDMNKQFFMIRISRCTILQMISDALKKKKNLNVIEYLMMRMKFQITKVISSYIAKL